VIDQLLKLIDQNITVFLSLLSHCSLLFLHLLRFSSACTDGRRTATCLYAGLEPIGHRFSPTIGAGSSFFLGFLFFILRSCFFFFCIHSLPTAIEGLVCIES
jgi:hypothetical protein